MDVLAAILACNLYRGDGLVCAIVGSAHDNPYANLSLNAPSFSWKESQPRDSNNIFLPARSAEGRGSGEPTP